MPTLTLLRSATSTGNPHGTAAFTAGAAFTPAANSLLYVMARAIIVADDGSEGNVLTVTDTLGTPLTYTPIAATTNSPAWSYGTRAWRANVGAAPAAMQVVVGSGGRNTQGYDVEVWQVTDFDATTPIGSVIAGSDADGDGPLQIDLPAAPLASSVVIAHLQTGLGGPSGTISGGAGWTEDRQAQLNDWMRFQTQRRTGSTSAAVNWADVLATGTAFGGASALAVEIRDVSAAGGGGSQALAGAAGGSGTASGNLTASGSTRTITATLYDEDGATLLASKTGIRVLVWASKAAFDAGNAPLAVITGQSTDANGLLSVAGPGSLSVGADACWIYAGDQDATPDTLEGAYVGLADVI